MISKLSVSLSTHSPNPNEMGLGKREIRECTHIFTETCLHLNVLDQAVALVGRIVS